MHTCPVAQNILPLILITSFNWVGGFRCLSENKRREGTMVAGCHLGKGGRLWLSGPVPPSSSRELPEASAERGVREAPADPGAPDSLPPEELALGHAPLRRPQPTAASSRKRSPSPRGAQEGDAEGFPLQPPRPERATFLRCVRRMRLHRESREPDGAP